MLPGRKVANRKNEVLDELKKQKRGLNAETLLCQQTKPNPELRAREDGLLTTQFLCLRRLLRGLLKCLCFFLFKAHGEEVGEVRSKSKITSPSR